MTYSLGLAAQLEKILRSKVTPGNGGVINSEHHCSLAAEGCPFGLALLSGWTVQTVSSIKDEYGNTVGTGRRLYSSDIQMLLPTEIDYQFEFSFHADLVLDFASRQARLSTFMFRFCGETYKFGDRHEYKPTIYDYMFAIGCSAPALSNWINPDEKVLRKIRRSWIKDFAPSRLSEST
jgi:hypothetical protein